MPEKTTVVNEIIHAFEHNIEDEKGSCKEEAHAFLFIFSTNQQLFNKSATTYSKVVYQKDVVFSKGLPNTMKLKAEADNLFNDDVYIMLGSSLAQEIHAPPNLNYCIKEKVCQKINLIVMNGKMFLIFMRYIWMVQKQDMPKI
ncbi:hypothetical protein [Moraxella catarrhalis]|uniref:hypothetical protein n=1 Tax=Moraxella catarrhalis TaxID=480 RepID=UPI0012DA70FC|nr:hypothetical protein [Moraxella catarrhalis]